MLDANPQRAWRKRSTRAAQAVGVGVAAIGLVGLLGWWVNAAALRSVVAGLAQMKPNTALGLIMCGTGLALGTRGELARRVRIGLGAAAGLLGLVTLVEYVVGTDLGVDGLLVSNTINGPRRMTPGAATALFLGGLGVSLTGVSQSRERVAWRVATETGLSLLVALIGTLALLGYLYGVQSLYRTEVFSSMALHTALSFALLGIGLSLCKPEQGLAKLVGSSGAGGVVARRAIGFFIVLMPLLGWLRLKGQELNWYDTPFGLALMLAMIIVVGIAAVWWTASALDRADSWRAALQEDLAASVSREHGTAAQRGAILNALPAAIALLSAEGRVVAVNQRWASLSPTGQAGGGDGGVDPIGRVFLEWGGPAVGAEDEGWARVSSEVRALLSGDSSGQVVALRAAPLSGAKAAGGNGTASGESWRWLEVRIAPVASVNSSRTGPRQPVGPPSGAVVMISDVTEQRRLEEQLVHSQRLEAVGRLAGGVAHDFNNLLTAVLGHSSLARGQTAAHSTISTNLEAIEQAARSGAELTQQLLAFGRRQVLAPRVVNVGDLISNVRRLIERSLGESIRLQVNVEEGLWPTRVDPGRIEQVIMNLVINARDAITAHGDGGLVIVEATNSVLDEAYSAARSGAVAPGDYVCISVSDTGTGMTPEVAARVFEPFFTTKERGKGTGLGLATSFGIVKQHGGHITVYSEVGAGSTFRVFLPAAPGESAEHRRASDSRAPRGTERVLLIDDHEAARAAVAGMLRSLGYAVTEAADGAQARRLAEVERGGFDLVVCDVMLPDGTGPEVVRQMSSVPGWESGGPAVLYISGYTANAVVNQGVLDAEVEFIAKPFSTDELGSRVRSVLDRRAAARAQT